MSIETVSYAGRAVILKRLGFRNYKLYLRSDLWKSIRDRLSRSWRKALGGHIYCYAGCGRPYTEWHHRTYRRSALNGEKADQYIVPLCRACHRGIEYLGTRKRKPDAVDVELGRLRSLRRPYWTNLENKGIVPLSKYRASETPVRPKAAQISACPR